MLCILCSSLFCPHAFKCVWNVREMVSNGHLQAVLAAVLSRKCGVSTSCTCTLCHPCGTPSTWTSVCRWLCYRSPIWLCDDHSHGTGSWGQEKLLVPGGSPPKSPGCWRNIPVGALQWGMQVPVGPQEEEVPVQEEGVIIWWLVVMVTITVLLCGYDWLWTSYGCESIPCVCWWVLHSQPVINDT